MSIKMRFDPNASFIVLDLNDMDNGSEAARLWIIFEFCRVPVVRVLEFLFGGANGRVELDCRVRSR